MGSELGCIGTACAVLHAFMNSGMEDIDCLFWSYVLRNVTVLDCGRESVILIWVINSRLVSQPLEIYVGILLAKLWRERVLSREVSFGPDVLFISCIVCLVGVGTRLDASQSLINT